MRTLWTEGEETGERPRVALRKVNGEKRRNEGHSECGTVMSYGIQVGRKLGPGNEACWSSVLVILINLREKRHIFRIVFVGFHFGFCPVWSWIRTERKIFVETWDTKQRDVLAFTSYICVCKKYIWLFLSALVLSINNLLWVNIYVKYMHATKT